MQGVTNKLNYWVTKVPEELKGLSELELSQRAMPHKWSKKEVLGHLCDSAINNLGRFIKAQYERQPFFIAPYHQDQWVDLQDYQNMPVEEIINLWCSLNKKIIQVVTKIPHKKRALLCDLGTNPLMPLEWLIHDYLAHMEHHLNQIFN